MDTDEEFTKANFDKMSQLKAVFFRRKNGNFIGLCLVSFLEVEELHLENCCFVK